MATCFTMITKLLMSQKEILAEDEDEAVVAVVVQDKVEDPDAGEAKDTVWKASGVRKCLQR